MEEEEEEEEVEKLNERGVESQQLWTIYFQLIFTFRKSVNVIFSLNFGATRMAGTVVLFF
jgi:hypothetical protein